EARWRIANTDSLQEYTNESIEQIKFEIVEMPTMKAHEKNILQITLKTTASNPLFSGMKKKRVGIGYRLEHNGNSETGKFLTPLMFDLVSEVRQRMIVVGPDQPGTYTIIPGWQVAAGDDERFYPFGEKVSVEFE
ncbi:MAG: hypothetical protein KDC13_00490, partial [Bacteroidetes bacterium]|nr:hypothetical protein [Bacteroidota bacterium]